MNSFFFRKLFKNLVGFSPCVSASSVEKYETLWLQKDLDSGLAGWLVAIILDTIYAVKHPSIYLSMYLSVHPFYPRQSTSLPDKNIYFKSLNFSFILFFDVVKKVSSAFHSVKKNRVNLKPFISLLAKI